MTQELHEDAPASKRRKLDRNAGPDTLETDSLYDSSKSPLPSLDRAISPPLVKRDRQKSTQPSATGSFASGVDATKTRYLSSPIQLTRIRDLPASHNIDTVGIHDILRDPMIKEAWQFNYLFDLDFLMGAFDPDIKDIVQVKVVHGSWKREDPHRITLEEQAGQYPNLQLITAHMPEAFGTHHSKMMILIRHDDLAQVIIHTANMISRDWANLTQAVWRSPLLPLQSPSLDTLSSSGRHDRTAHPIGSGSRFKVDLLRYLQAYGNRLKGLVTQLQNYDFSAIRAALIASTPCRQDPRNSKSATQTSFGWPGLSEVLKRVPITSPKNSESPPSIVIQISSIATLGQNPTWLDAFKKFLSSTSTTTPSSTASSFFSKSGASAKNPKPTFNIIFPTPLEIRNSLDGYASGASIHMKLQSAAQQKQLAYMKPILSHWWKEPTPPYDYLASVLAQESNPREHPQIHSESEGQREALRGPAAPHIKTFIRFSDQTRKSIDWAMVTSANLSTQAWGSLPNQQNEVRVSSYEIGVVVWPDLFKDSADEVVRMVPSFGKDGPNECVGGEAAEGAGDEKAKAKGAEEAKQVILGFRMPYDLPLTPYGRDDEPWCATAEYEEPDWKGVLWTKWT